MTVSDYLAGRATLAETLAETMPGMGAGGNLPFPISTRDEQLRMAWRELLTKFECVWLDVLDISEDTYMEAAEHLEEIRRLDPKSCRQALDPFDKLIDILEQRSENQDTDDWRELQLHLSRMEQLRDELDYVCDEYAPGTPRPPGAPPKDKDQHKQDKERKSKSKKKSKKKKKKSKKKSKKESRRRVSSKVVASLCQALDEEDKAAALVVGGQALARMMTEETDCASVYTEAGAVYPGHAPRLDVYLEWERDGRPSDCYGLARLYVSPAEGIVIEDANGGSERALPFEVQESKLADEIYDVATVFHDVQPRRIWTEARVVPALYRMLRRGGDISESSWAHTLSALRLPISLSEGCDALPMEIHLSQDGPRRFFFEWAVQGPTMEPEIEQPPEGALHEDQVGKGARPGKHVEIWQTPVVRLDVREQTVYIETEDGDEEVEPDTQDEDVAAALLTLSKVNEDAERGHLIEADCSTFQVDRRTRMGVYSTAVGTGYGPLTEAEKFVVGATVYYDDYEDAADAGIDGPLMDLVFDHFDGGDVKSPRQQGSSWAVTVWIRVTADVAGDAILDVRQALRNLNDGSYDSTVNNAHERMWESDTRLSGTMLRYHNKAHQDDSWHQCGGCEFCIPKYPGRYPRHCPNCGCDMAGQKGYPYNDNILPTAKDTEPYLADAHESYVPLRERVARWDKVQDRADATLAEGEQRVELVSIGSGEQPYRFLIRAPFEEARSASLTIQVADVEKLQERATQIVERWAQDQDSLTVETMAPAGGSTIFDPPAPPFGRETGKVSATASLPIEGTEEDYLKPPPRGERPHGGKLYDGTDDEEALDQLEEPDLDEIMSGGLPTSGFAESLDEVGVVDPNIIQDEQGQAFAREMLWVDEHSAMLEETLLAGEPGETGVYFTRVVEHEQSGDLVKMAFGPFQEERYASVFAELYAGDDRFAETEYLVQEEIEYLSEFPEGHGVTRFETYHPRQAAYPDDYRALGGGWNVGLREVAKALGRLPMTERGRNLHPSAREDEPLLPHEEVLRRLGKYVREHCGICPEDDPRLRHPDERSGLQVDEPDDEWDVLGHPDPTREPLHTDLEPRDEFGRMTMAHKDKVGHDGSHWMRDLEDPLTGELPGDPVQTVPLGLDEAQDFDLDDLLTGGDGTVQVGVGEPGSGETPHDEVGEVPSDPLGISTHLTGTPVPAAEEFQPDKPMFLLGPGADTAAGLAPSMATDPAMHGGGHPGEDGDEEVEEFTDLGGFAGFGGMYEMDMRMLEKLIRHGLYVEREEDLRPGLRAAWRKSIKLAGRLYPSLEENDPIFKAAATSILKDHLREVCNYQPVEETMRGSNRFQTGVAVVFRHRRDGAEILLGRAITEDARNGQWCFPGGGIDEEDRGSVEEAAERECWEETGIAVLTTGTVIDHPRKPQVGFVACDYLFGQIKPNREFSKVKWVPLKELHEWAEDEDARVYSVNRQVLERLRTYLEIVEAEHLKELGYVGQWEDEEDEDVDEAVSKSKISDDEGAPKKDEEGNSAKPAKDKGSGGSEPAEPPSPEELENEKEEELEPESDAPEEDEAAEEGEEEEGGSHSQPSPTDKPKVIELRFPGREQAEHAVGLLKSLDFSEVQLDGTSVSVAARNQTEVEMITRTASAYDLELTQVNAPEPTSPPGSDAGGGDTAPPQKQQKKEEPKEPKKDTAKELDKADRKGSEKNQSEMSKKLG